MPQLLELGFYHNYAEIKQGSEPPISIKASLNTIIWTNSDCETLKAEDVMLDH